MNDLEDEREIMMYLRHEAGTRSTTPTSSTRRRVARALRSFPSSLPRHYRRSRSRATSSGTSPGWYAQKHPDEDFAETFAVWLTPRSEWRKRYKGWGALAKLRYVDRMARRLRDTEPLRPQGRADLTVDEMDTTVADFYQKALQKHLTPAELALDTDLTDIFQGLAEAEEARPPRGGPGQGKPQDARGQGRLLDRRAPPLDQGARRVDRDARRRASLRADTRREKEHLAEITAYTTALAANYVMRGKFVQP
jgi:hypothetical protein